MATAERGEGGHPCILPRLRIVSRDNPPRMICGPQSCAVDRLCRRCSPPLSLKVVSSNYPIPYLSLQTIRLLYSVVLQVKQLLFEEPYLAVLVAHSVAISWVSCVFGASADGKFAFALRLFLTGDTTFSNKSSRHAVSTLYTGLVGLVYEPRCLPTIAHGGSVLEVLA